MSIKRLVFITFCILVVSLGFGNRSPGLQIHGILERVNAIPARPEWNRFKILVWQYHTSVLEDINLYRRAGLGGFHIDRGYGKEDLVAWSKREELPYYVDHAGDKGLLHLVGADAQAVTGKAGLVSRPRSLADPKTIEEIKNHLFRNIVATRDGLVLTYAFDDEISVGCLIVPCDVDIHPHSLAWFRRWLKGEYESIDRLNEQWESNFKDFSDVMPKGFEEVRKKLPGFRLSKWNLSSWMDFRHFMDFQFSAVLSELCHYANSIDPKTPAGFGGGQAPGPWGGFDYAMLSRAVQWMEAYDIHGTNEILRSFWNEERRPRMQTFFSSRDPKIDSWFLWYYMLHGNHAVIAWPDGWFRVGEQDIAPHILSNKKTFEEIQGTISENLVCQQAVFDPDPIGLYYSHPSVQAGWAMDALAHGSTWINRFGSIDNENQTKGVLRKAWCKILEDLGYQYDFISYLDVKQGAIDLSERFKVIVLPKTICLSEVESLALKSFVERGGTLIADNLCGLMDDRGKGCPQGALDDIFGLIRDETLGYMNGRGLAEIDGERYERSFLERLTHYHGAYRYKDIVVFERGTRPAKGAEGVEVKGTSSLLEGPSVLIRNQIGRGQTIYLNLSPIEYWHPDKRFSAYGNEWRSLVLEILQRAGIEPRVKVYENGHEVNMIECLYWKSGQRRFLGLVKNPTKQRLRKFLGCLNEVQGISGEESEVRLEFRNPVSLVNLRTHQNLGVGQIFHDRFRPWEGNLYQAGDAPEAGP